MLFVNVMPPYAPLKVRGSVLGAFVTAEPLPIYFHRKYGGHARTLNIPALSQLLTILMNSSPAQLHFIAQLSDKY